jgi:hypothetical protein
LLDKKGAITNIAAYINQPNLPDVIRRYLYHQLADSDINSNASDSDVTLADLPPFTKFVSLHSSASSIFFAPSDPSGIHGMRKEQIRSTFDRRGGGSRQDCVLINTGGDPSGPLSGYSVARVLLLLSFTHAGERFPCALVWWYTLSDTSGRRDNDTGMWLVEHEFKGGEPHISVVHTDTIFRAVHLLPFFGKDRVPLDLSYKDSLDYYDRFYVNRYADHHSFEIL